MATAKPKKKAAVKQPYDILRIESRRSSEEPRDVVVQINGYKYNMQRNEILPVPRNVVTVLKEAKYKKWDHSQIVNGRPLEFEITRFPFSVLYQDIGDDAYDTLRTVAQTRSLTQEDVDVALNPEQGDG